MLPWADARASETETDQADQAASAGPVAAVAPADARKPLLIRNDLWDTPAGLPPGQSPQVMRQAVASTSQHNFILGTTATVLIVGGVALIAYSTTPSCKQSQPVSTRCDRDKVLGAIGIAGGTVMLVLWALSK
jgi:hypothetical protein